ncbi:MAG: hypothetical protein KDC48_19115 [Planctomycetes bacterium]|nr:hypothetical protein [Planctomycetota bacterium]
MRTFRSSPAALTRSLLAAVAVSTLLCALPLRADVLLYRGAHVYLVPKVLGDRILAIAPGTEWRHFPSFTRRIDSNSDGRDDFIAIGIGNDDGHGVQIRYRLERPGDGGAERIGNWYWAVLTDQSGNAVFESYND